MLITFEGIDGLGKTTVMAAVVAYLVECRLPIVSTREPGGCVLANKVRELLLDPEHLWLPTAELLLYMASRAQHVGEVVRPAINDSKIVLCDRFTDSSLAYQAIARGMGMENVEALNAIATKGLVPDLTVLFDADPTVGAHRLAAAGKGDRMDTQNPVFYRKARVGFLSIAQREPRRFRTVDANPSLEEVTDAAIAIVGGFLVEHGYRVPHDDRRGRLVLEDGVYRCPKAPG